MQLKPDQTPDTYNSASCIKEVNEHIKVFKNTTTAGEVFFHIAREPPIEEINSPEDIETIAAFQVAHDETVEEVEETAVLTAYRKSE